MRREIRQWWKKNRNKVIIGGAIAGAIGGYIWSKKTGVTVDYDQEAADFVSKYMTKAPSVGQQLEIERRKKSGETMGDILSSMRLL